MKFTEYIFIYASHKEYPSSAVSLAVALAEKAEKPVCFLTSKNEKETDEKIENVLSGWSEDLCSKVEKGVEWKVLTNSKADFEDFIEQSEASSLIFALSEHKGFNNVRRLLKMARPLRVPYFFVKPYFDEVNLERILCPVTMLVEDRQKGVYASNLGKSFGSKVLMMTAKDYGSKAKQNSESIVTLLDKYGIQHEEVQAERDSYKVEREAVERAKELSAGMVLVSASRSYGLDDILFGPKEERIINDTDIPLLLINPRADLYVLCG